MASDDRHPPRKKALMQYHVIDLDECAAEERFGTRPPLYVKYQRGNAMMDRKEDLNVN